MTVLELDGTMVEVRSSEEVGEELGGNVLRLMQNEIASVRPIHFLTVDAAQSAMHEAFKRTVEFDEVLDSSNTGVVKVIKSANLLQEEIMGVDYRGKDCPAGWNYSVYIRE
ncbi:MAG: hypothetical protein M3Q14_02405 [bacterium]|nr:hypothetical protein [bacterium]